MKKILSIALISLSFLPACKKAFEQPTEWSSVAVIQASPVLAPLQGVLTDTLHVFIDTMRYNSTGIFYNTNTTYLPVRPGSKTVDIRRGVNSTYAKYINSFNYTFESLKAYSFFLYDTTTSPTGQAKVLRLKDDLTLPAANTSKVRFLHLAPTNAAVDITLVRTSVTPNDSVTISNQSYVGTVSSPNEEALSAFTAIPRGTYTAKIKTAGTQTVLTSSTGIIPSTATGADVNQGRIITLYVTGTAKGRLLALGSFRHY